MPITFFLRFFVLELEDRGRQTNGLTDGQYITSKLKRDMSPVSAVENRLFYMYPEVEYVQLSDT